MTLDPADEDAITAALLRRTVLLEWRGFVRADGVPEPYDAERARAMLGDPAFRRFRTHPSSVEFMQTALRRDAQRRA